MDPRRRETGPRVADRISENQPGGRFGLTVPPPPAVTHDALSREFIDGYGEGFRDGVNHGRQQADDEQRGRGAVSAAIAAQVARMGPADELEERRGRPERAARLRQIMADRGITA